MDLIQYKDYAADSCAISPTENDMAYRGLPGIRIKRSLLLIGVLNVKSHYAFKFTTWQRISKMFYYP